jgi:hypothetical protein
MLAQATQVIEIRDVLVGGVGADEAVDGRHRLVVLACLVFRVGLFHQRLLGVGAVRILCDQAAEGLGCGAPAALFHGAVGLVVQLADRQAFVLVLVLEHALDAGAAAGGKDKGDEQDGAQQGGTSGHGHRVGAWRHGGLERVG